jgi:PPR repeat
MDELYLAGNKGVKPDTYTYNTLINCWYVFELWIR